MKITRSIRSFIIACFVITATTFLAAWLVPNLRTASAADLTGLDDKQPDAPQAFGVQQKLVDPTRENNARLGSSVVIGPDFALVGTHLDDVGANADQGSVLYYTRTGSTWTFQQRIIASDGTAGESFGEEIALSGNTLVVGLRGDTIGGNGSQGSVYVFTRSGNVWTEQQKLTAADGASGDQLGGEVSIDGDTLIAGAQNHAGTVGTDQGAAYVFTRSGVTWTQQQKLTVTDGYGDDHFGEHVGINGDTVVIGVPDADIGPPPTPNIGQGSAYVFVRSSGVWSQQQKILGPATEDGFAETVAIDGETVALANTNYFDAGSPDFSQGAVYVFTRTAAVWSQQQTLTASDRYFTDRFGNSIDIEGDKIVVGASLANIGAVLDQGAAYVFSRTAGVWTEQKKLFAPDGETSDQFGHSVAISGQDVIAGALFESSTGAANSFGAAYVFSDAFATSPAGCAWTNDVLYPINIRNQGAAVQGTSIFSFGGLSNNVVMANAYKFDGDRWTAIAPLPVALWGTAVASDGTYLYIAGGLNAANTTVNTMYRYDPVLNTYSNMQNAPSATWVSSAAFVNGKIHKIGGLTTSVGGAVNTVSAYDIAGNTWSAAANYPGAFGWIATTVDGGFIYSAGGTDGNISFTQKAYRYDPVGNAWNDAAVTDLPSANNSLAMGFLNGSLVIAGGASPDVLRLDPATNTWGGGTSLLPNVYRSRQHLAGVILGNEFHIIGGVTSGFNGTRDHFKLVCGNALAPPTSCGIATSYTGSAVAIPDNNAAGVDIPITVSGIGTVTDLDFRFDGTPNGAATLQGVEHTNVGQLVFKLTSPMGTSLTFINRMSRTTAVGGCDNNNLSQVLLNDDAILPIDLQCSENSTVRPGTYSPGDKFSVFNGEPADGIWTLNVSDNASGTTGNVRRFSLLFGACSTAASVQVSGRVLTAEGRGVRGARVSLVDTNGVSRIVNSGPRGEYIFDDVEPGKTYIISAASRRFTFTPQVIQITDDLTNFDLVAQGISRSEKEQPMARKR